MKIYLILLLSICLSCINGNSDKHLQITSTQQNDSLTGTWRGTSICQVKTSPCHDELAVYHISRKKQPNAYEWIMSKMVNGKEEEMGVTDYTYNPATKTFIGHSRPTDTWKFVVKGNTMEGTLMENDSVLYRVINLVKDRQ